MKIFHTDGNWRLCYSDFMKMHCIVHSCDGWERKKPVEGQWYDYKYFRIPCSRCNETIPEGLQALFVMMTGDMDQNA